MKNVSRRSLALRYLAASALCLCGWTAAHAQAFPSKPVKLVVTYPAGGSSDLMARIIAEPLAARLGPPSSSNR